MTLEGSQLTIIIPVYNEAASLPKLLQELFPFAKSRNFKIIIVNDGSIDNTKALLNEMSNDDNRVTVLHHKINRGYGGAIKTGIINASTKYSITIDSDGQHSFSDIDNMLSVIIENDADLIVGNRKGNSKSGIYREFGKSVIRIIAKLLMPLKIYDINSGMKLYNTKLAKRFIQLCPDSMAFSDVITLIFVYQRCLVMEVPVKIKKRIAGKSTISTRTAFETMMEIINIVVLFNPMRIFLPLSITFIIISLLWEIPILLKGYGISTGAFLGFMIGIIFFLLGLIAEQLGNIRKLKINNDH